MLVSILQPEFDLANAKGRLTQLVSGGWNQYNVIISPKGCVRGGHYHKLNKEAFYLIKGKLRLILEMDGVKEDYIFQECDMFLISPYQNHTFEYLEETILVSMYDKGVELGGGKMDIYRPDMEGNESSCMS